MKGFGSGVGGGKGRGCDSLLLESQMSGVWQGGGKTPAFFADAAEGALLSAWMEVAWRLLDLEAWLAQSSERLGLAVWPRCVRCDDCVLQ